MASCNLNFTILICFILMTQGVKAQLNMTLYKHMPPLHVYEDYDECLSATSHQSHAPTYCMVYAEIVPNEKSILWETISQVSADYRRRFRHDHLFFGVCLEKCHKLLGQVNYLQQDGHQMEKVKDTDLIDYFSDVHKRETDERVRFDRLVGSCLNFDFKQKYQLTLRTSIEYCEVADKPLKYDLLDKTFLLILAFFGLCNLLSSLFDFYMRRKTPVAMQDQFYKIDQCERVHYFLTSFSICRNYYRITLPSSSATYQDLRFFNAYRVFSIFVVIFGHVLMVFVTLPTHNPEFLENFFYNIVMAVIQNGALIIQIFFVMSGFLLNVNFREKQHVNERTKLNKCVTVYLKLLISRYTRLLPSLIMLVLFNATVLTRLQDGPIWRHHTEAERVFCREYWWKNIFLINNYMMKKSCSHHTWYIAADVQLFELFALILIIVTIYPKLKTTIFSVLALCTMAIPAMITYFLKFDAVYHLAPETYRYLYFKDAEMYFQTYPTFYTNIGGYLFGIISADIYLKAKQENSLNKLRGVLKYELLWWLIFPIGCALLFFGDFTLYLDLAKPSIWNALFAGFYKISWVLLCCLTLLGNCSKLGWIAYDICKMPMFLPLARISYQTYIWHVVVIRLLGGYFRHPIYINRFLVACNVIACFVLSLIVAFFFAITFEYPIAAMFRCMTVKTKIKSSKDNIEKIGMAKYVFRNDR